MRVALSELGPDELTALLVNEVEPADFGRLLGFSELGQALSSSGFENTKVSDNAEFECNGFSYKLPLTLKSQVAQVSRDLLSRSLTFKRYESDETTSDESLASTWGKTGYLQSGTASILFLRRIEEYWLDRESIVVKVNYNFIKIPNKAEYAIHTVTAEMIPLSKFCDYFRAEAPSLAVDLLWQLSGLYQKTADHMEGVAKQMREKSNVKTYLSLRIG